MEEKESASKASHHEFDENARKILIVFSAAYIAAISAVAWMTGEQLSLVFIGMSPLLLYMCAFFGLYIYEMTSSPMIWAVPLVFPLIAFLIWKGDYAPFIKGMDWPTLAVMNALLSYALNAVFLILRRKEQEAGEGDGEKQPSPYQQMAQYYHQQAQYHSQRAEEHRKEAENLKKQLSEYKESVKVTQANFKVQLRNIEDKCKAINFVIGRVYSEHNGGSRDIREKLKIKRELYNNFSEMISNFKGEYSINLLELLKKIFLNITALEFTETQAFGKKVHSKNDEDLRIIDILAKYDRDPLMDYYTEAKDVCVGLINYLKAAYGLK